MLKIHTDKMKVTVSVLNSAIHFTEYSSYIGLWLEETHSRDAKVDVEKTELKGRLCLTWSDMGCWRDLVGTLCTM